MAEEENVDMLLVIAVIGGEQLRNIILEAMGDIKTRKALVVTIMAGTTHSVGQDFPMLLSSGISVYPDSARAANALARLSEYARFRERWSAM